MNCGVATVSATASEEVMLPDVPVIVSVAPLAVTDEFAVRVRVLVPLVVAGEKEAVTPLGSPEVARLTVPVNPYSGVTVTVALVVPPGVIVRPLGAVVRANVGV